MRSSITFSDALPPWPSQVSGLLNVLVTVTVGVLHVTEKHSGARRLLHSASQPCLLCFPFNVQMLTEHDYIQGNEFSVADVAVGCTL